MCSLSLTRKSEAEPSAKTRRSRAAKRCIGMQGSRQLRILSRDSPMTPNQSLEANGYPACNFILHD
jgi:hypothetical protein